MCIDQEPIGTYERDLRRMTEASIEPFARVHLAGLIELVAAEGWAEYTDDVERTYRALTAPGVTTLIAIAGERVVGVIQVQSDGVIQAHVSMLLVDRSRRGPGLAPGSCAKVSIVPEAFRSTSALGPRVITSGLARAARSASASRARTSDSGAKPTAQRPRGPARGRCAPRGGRSSHREGSRRGRTGSTPRRRSLSSGRHRGRRRRPAPRRRR
jgi:hypothetical protein